MRNPLRSRTVAVTAAAGVLVGAGGIGAAQAAGAHLPWNSVGTHQIRNHSIRGVDVHPNTIGVRHLNDHAKHLIWSKADRSDVQDLANKVDGMAGNGTLGANFTSKPTVVQNIGGPFATNATKLGEVTLQPGTYVVNAEGLFESQTSTSGKSQLELALRGPKTTDNPYGDFGTCFTGETSPTKGRDASCASTKAVTVTEPTTVTVYAFGYQDDQSSTDSGSWMAVGTVNAIQVGD